MGASVFLAAVELGRLVVLAGPALDLLFLGEETLELGVGLLDQRRGLGEVLVSDRGLVARRGLAGGTAAASAGAHDPSTGCARGLPDRHRGLFGDLVLGRGLVGQDLAL